MKAWICTGYRMITTWRHARIYLRSPEDPLRTTFARSAKLSVQIMQQVNAEIGEAHEAGAKAQPVLLERVP